MNRIVRSEQALAVVAGPQVPSTRVMQTVLTTQAEPSYSYGAGTQGAWDALQPQTEISPGDVLRITYRLKMPFLEEWQSKFLIAKLATDSRYQLRSYQLYEEESRLVVEVAVVKSGTPALVIGIAIAAVVAGGLIFMSVQSIERLTKFKLPGGLGDVNLAPVIILAALAVGAYVIFKFR